jgi:chemotaxis protein MotB
MARKRKHEEEEKLERWLVSYADFITLLFAFFTVMYAISQADKSKYQKAAESISKAFLSSGGIFPLQGSPFTPFEKAPDQGSVVPPSPTDDGRFAKEDKEALDRAREDIKGLFEKSTGLSLKSGEIDVYKTEQGFKIRLDESLLFKPGADRIKRSNIPFLVEMGKRLARLGFQVQVEGYSDKHEKGADAAWRLSLDRSYNVMRFLVEGVGFPKEQISVSGYGDSRPLASESTSEGRAKNRRVEIAVITGARSLGDISW